MKQYRVLIADDHAMIRNGLKNLISENPEFAIAGEAGSGKEALQLFETLRPDVVIMDISMPDINGMEVSAQILQRHPDAKIVIFSMYDGEGYISRCLEIGVKGYVLKSDSGSELDYALRTVAKGNNYFSRHAQDVIFKKYTQQVGKKQGREQIKLTEREIEIVKLIADGFTSQQMADKLFISPRTVETHRANLMKKVGVHNAMELVKRIQELDLI